MVEAAKRVIRPHKRPNRGPHRHFDRNPEPLGHAHPDRDIAPLIEAVVRRIAANRHTTGAGSWLLADTSGAVFVLSDCSGTAEPIIARHPEQLVGLYVEVPDHAQLRGDLIRHFIDIGLVTVEMIYDAVRMEEG